MKDRHQYVWRRSAPYLRQIQHWRSTGKCWLIERKSSSIRTADEEHSSKVSVGGPQGNADLTARGSSSIRTADGVRVAMMDKVAAYICRQMTKSAVKFNFGGPDGDADFIDERSTSIRTADGVCMVVGLSPGKDPTDVDRWTGPRLHLQTDGQVCSSAQYAQCILRFF